MNGSSRNVLVVNARWRPINIVSALEAFVKVFQGKAVILDENYMEYGWKEWVENWSDVSKVATVMASKLINTSQGVLVAPDVVIMKKCKKDRHRNARPTRNSIYKRDNGVCQYCGRKFHSQELNIDHIVPQAQGGKTSWGNVVLSCIKCNGKKGNRTPAEAGMKLIRVPREPHWALVEGAVSDQKMPTTWKAFIDKMYWNIELEE